MTCILLIEDNDNNRDMLMRRLQKKGFDILTAIDGKQGVEIAERSHPDLILMDMGLPVLDGWEATRQIKSNIKTKEIPVIGLSAHAMLADRKKALDAGCCDYDTKPVDLDRLINIISRNLVIEQNKSTNRNTTIIRNQQKVKILVADDDDACLNLIDRFLENEGCDIVLAKNGEQAWEYLKSEEHTFNVAILDRKMPGLTGIEILQKMKTVDRLNNVPVIFQTGLINIEDIREGMDEGAYYYLTKPYIRRSLISIVEAAISESLKKQQLILDVHNPVDTDISSLNGHMVFKSLDEINNIACTLANICPDPEVTVCGLSELLTNAVEHGNLEISYDDKKQLLNDNRWYEEVNYRLELPEYVDRKVNVFWEKDDSQICFIIKDEGKGFFHEKYLELDPNRATHPHGRGIAMANMISFTSIEFIGCGNQVVATIQI